MASNTKWPARAFSLFFALLFIIPIISSAVYVIYQQSHKTEDTTVNNTLAGTQLSGFTPSTNPVTELQKIDTTIGTGEEVKSSAATVTVNYTGALVKTGIIFESSLDSGQTATFGLTQVIQGWTDGIPGMKVGGTRRLIIPAAQAYGAQSPSSSIPANSDLVFDVTLVAVTQ